MGSLVMEMLKEWGPQRDDVADAATARQYCDRLVRGHGENFSVLSRFVPADRVDAFAAVYAFCRWADDLADEAPDPERALELLAWWGDELNRLESGAPRHPITVALAPVVERHNLSFKLFRDLLDAFEQDQRVTRYDTWTQLLAYCRRSANPVGRLVLEVLGEKPGAKGLEASDAICTALQLTNHWQDIRRDLVERDRIYVPAEFLTLERFEERLRDSAAQGFAVDHTFLSESRTIVAELVKRTWTLYEQGDALLPLIGEESRPIVWLFTCGGQRTLRLIEQWNCETVLHRPSMGRPTKMMLVFGTLFRRWLGVFRTVDS